MLSVLIPDLFRFLMEDAMLFGKRTPLEIFMEHEGLDETRTKERLEMIALGSPDQYRRTIEGMAVALNVEVDWPSQGATSSPTERLRAARGDDRSTIVERRPTASVLGPNDTHPGVEEPEGA